MTMHWSLATPAADAGKAGTAFFERLSECSFPAFLSIQPRRFR